MRSTSLVTLFSVLFLSVHVAVDHCFVTACLMTSEHEAGAVCGHSHSAEFGAESGPDDHSVPVDPCEEGHQADFIRSSLAKNVLVDNVDPLILGASQWVSSTVVDDTHLEFSPDTLRLTGPAPIFVLNSSLLI